MTWTTLGESLDAVLSGIRMDGGNAGAGTLADAMKRTGAVETPAKVGNLNAHECHAVREIVTATPAPRRASPTHAVAISLIVDNTKGGRPAEGGGSSRAAYRALQAVEGARWRRELRVVGGRDHADAPF